MLTCPICHAQKKNLTKHVQMAHHLTKDEFLSQYPGTKMISDSASKAISESLRANWKNPDYAERCSSYWRSELHAQRKSEDMKVLWDTRHDEMVAGIKQFANSEEGRSIRSQNLTNSLNDLWQDETYRKNRSEQGKKQMRINALNPEFNKFHRVEYNGRTYRSKLEVKFVKIFDKLNIKNEYETVRLPYEDENGDTHIYITDFFLPEFDTIVEVKPECFVDSLNHGKSQTVKSHGYNYVILTEKDLSSEKVLRQLQSTGNN